jgi:Undecaprenyl-phosphate glucose phosphotransferase
MVLAMIETVPKALPATYRPPALHLPRALVVFGCITADFLVVGLSVHAGDFIYHSYVLQDGQGNPHVFVFAWLAAILFVAFESLSGAYAIRAYIVPMAGPRTALLSWIMVSFVVAWVGILTKTTGAFSRGALTTSFAVGAVAIVLVRIGTAKVLRAGLGKGAIAVQKAHLICVGAQAPAELIGEAQKYGVDITGISVLAPERLNGQAFGRRCKELAGQLCDSFQREPFDEIYLFLPWEKRRPLRELATALGRLPLPVFLFADAEMERLLQTPGLLFGSFKGFEVQRAPLTWAERVLKRSLDVSVALIGIILLAPLLIAVALAIRATSGSPVIFRQERQGFCGKRFRIYKFRTMRVCEDGPTIAQVTAHDPRVTPLGSILRRKSIDELPQLFNVLKGDMSIVGPRPHAVAHDEHYSSLISFYARRHIVKPGLTGCAQINGYRGETKELNAMTTRVAIDLWYINNWSIWLDIQIICRTALHIMFTKDVY